MSDASPPWEARLGGAEGQAILRRVADRISRGEEPPSVSLPDEKAAFPKLLCLDQNMWIGLARAHYGKPGGERGRAALEAIRAATRAKRLVVPVTASNISEVFEPRDEDRRRRLATFMVDLSENLSLVHPATVAVVELENAIKRLFLGATDTTLIRPQLVRWGMSAAAAGRELRFEVGDKTLDVLITQVTNEPEVSIEKLIFAVDGGAVERLRERDEAGRQVIEGVRQIDGHLSPEERRPGEMYNLIRGRTYVSRISAVLAALSIPTSIFARWIEQAANLLALTNALPQVWIGSTLMFERDRNPQERAEANDFKDLTFLEQAITYGNVVVTEKLWTHIANTTGLSATYGTRVLASLTDLPQVLADEGCI